MAFKVIEPENFNVTEEVKPIKTRPKFSLDNINISTEEMWYYTVRCGIGLFILIIGIINAGSYYLPATRLMNAPATFFYSWQVANLLIISGVLIIYHYLFGSGRL